MELRKLAKEYYESHRTTFKNLSLHSQNLLGGHVSIDQLKQWSMDDGGWKKPDVAVDKRLQFMATLLADKIEEEGPEMPAKDLVAMIGQYLNLILKAPMDLDASAKPTVDEILDQIDALDARTN